MLYGKLQTVVSVANMQLLCLVVKIAMVLLSVGYLDSKSGCLTERLYRELSVNSLCCTVVFYIMFYILIVVLNTYYLLNPDTHTHTQIVGTKINHAHNKNLFFCLKLFYYNSYQNDLYGKIVAFLSVLTENVKK